MSPTAGPTPGPTPGPARGGRRWIAIVVGLLVGNAVAVAVLLAVAGGDTSRRVLPDYYGQAAAWDDVMAQQAASARLGWRCATRVDGRLLEVACHDAAGLPLAGVDVTVRALPRGRADEPVEVRLVEAGAGVHRAPLPGVRGGLHQLDLTVARGAERWTATRTVELTAAAPRAGT